MRESNKRANQGEQKNLDCLLRDRNEIEPRDQEGDVKEKELRGEERGDKSGMYARVD